MLPARNGGNSWDTAVVNTEEGGDDVKSLRAGNIGRGLRSLRDLTQHLTTRADDNHAPPVYRPCGERISTLFRYMSSLGKVLRVASN